MRPTVAIVDQAVALPGSCVARDRSQLARDEMLPVSDADSIARIAAFEQRRTLADGEMLFTNGDRGVGLIRNR